MAVKWADVSSRIVLTRSRTSSISRGRRKPDVYRVPTDAQVNAAKNMLRFRCKAVTRRASIEVPTWNPFAGPRSPEILLRGRHARLPAACHQPKGGKAGRSAFSTLINSNSGVPVTHRVLAGPRRPGIVLSPTVSPPPPTSMHVAIRSNENPFRDCVQIEQCVYDSHDVRGRINRRISEDSHLIGPLTRSGADLRLSAVSRGSGIGKRSWWMP